MLSVPMPICQGLKIKNRQSKKVKREFQGSSYKRKPIKTKRALRSFQRDFGIKKTSPIAGASLLECAFSIRKLSNYSPNPAMFSVEETSWLSKHQDTFIIQVRRTF
jgi:hypothetical protein